MSAKFKIGIILAALLVFNQAIIPAAYTEDIKQPEKTGEQVIQVQQPKPDIQSEIQLNIEKDQVPITLEESLETALKNNLNLQIISSQKNQNKWVYYNTLSEFLPDVNYNYNATRLGGNFLFGGFLPVSVTTTYITTGFTGQWDGFTGFSRYFNAKAARNNYKAAKKNVDLNQDQLLLLTTQQYYNLLRSKLNIDILKKALEQTKAQLSLNLQRYDAGVGTKFDVIRAEAQVASSEQSLIEAINTYKLVQAQLANTIGIDVFTPLAPAEDTVRPKTLISESYTLSDLTEMAFQTRPDIDIAKYNLEATKSVRNTSLSVYLPTASVITTVNGNGSAINNLVRNQSVGLIVNWNAGNNLGLGGVTNFKALNEQVKQSKINVQNTIRNIEQNVVNAYTSSISAKDLIRASKAQVNSAEESLRLSLVRLEAGVGIYTDVIAAQLTETQARINYLNSIINYNISQTQLLYDTGVISANNVLQGYTPSSISKNGKKSSSKKTK